MRKLPGVLAVAAVLGLSLWLDFGHPADPEAEEPAGEQSSEWRRFSKRCAGDSLRTMTAAETEIQGNDRDGCHVNDFWAPRVADLYRLTGAAMPDNDQAIKLIELSIASAEEEESPD